MNNQSATMNTKDNPLGYKKESTLLVGFAIPCIISMLVTALYNIVDQIFIGQGIGMLGNAATNIVLSFNKMGSTWSPCLYSPNVIPVVPI